VRLIKRRQEAGGRRQEAGGRRSNTSVIFCFKSFGYQIRLISSASKMLALLFIVVVLPDLILSIKRKGH
jgi:hypothetical protein